MKKQYILTSIILLGTPFSVYATEEVGYRGIKEWILYGLLIIYFIISGIYLRKISTKDK